MGEEFFKEFDKYLNYKREKMNGQQIVSDEEFLRSNELQSTKNQEKPLINVEKPKQQPIMVNGKDSNKQLEK